MRVVPNAMLAVGCSSYARVLRADAIDAMTFPALMAGKRQPLERGDPELIRAAAGVRRPSYGRGSGERRTSGGMRQNRHAGGDQFVVWQNDPDRRPVRL